LNAVALREFLEGKRGILVATQSMFGSKLAGLAHDVVLEALIGAHRDLMG